MRVLNVSFIFLAIMVILCAGCGENSDLTSSDEEIVNGINEPKEEERAEVNESEKQEQAEEEQSVFGLLGPGTWAESVISFGDVKGSRMKTKYIGTDIYNEKECYVIEYEFTAPVGMMGGSISQAWFEKSTGECILYVMKAGILIMKQDTGFMSALSEPVQPGYQKIGEGDYVTPTGKELEVAIYTFQDAQGDNEYWISDEVPLGTAKHILNGQEMSYLQDFGEGAKRLISKQEALNAQ